MAKTSHNFILDSVPMKKAANKTKKYKIIFYFKSKQTDGYTNGQSECEPPLVCNEVSKVFETLLLWPDLP